MLFNFTNEKKGFYQDSYRARADIGNVVFDGSLCDVSYVHKSKSFIATYATNRSDPPVYLFTISDAGQIERKLIGTFEQNFQESTPCAAISNDEQVVAVGDINGIHLIFHEGEHSTQTPTVATLSTVRNVSIFQLTENKSRVTAVCDKEIVFLEIDSSQYLEDRAVSPIELVRIKLPNKRYFPEPQKGRDPRFSHFVGNNAIFTVFHDFTEGNIVTFHSPSTCPTYRRLKSFSINDGGEMAYFDDKGGIQKISLSEIEANALAFLKLE